MTADCPQGSSATICGDGPGARGALAERCPPNEEAEATPVRRGGGVRQPTCARPPPPVWLGTGTARQVWNLEVREPRNHHSVSSVCVQPDYCSRLYYNQVACFFPKGDISRDMQTRGQRRRPATFFLRALAGDADATAAAARARMAFKPGGVPLNVWRATRRGRAASCARAPCQRLGGPRPATMSLGGELAGWEVEVRTLAGGRQYRVYISPAGRKFASYVAAKRSCAATEG